VLSTPRQALGSGQPLAVWFAVDVTPSSPKFALLIDSHVMRVQFSERARYRTAFRADQWSKQAAPLVKEATMNKIIITLMAIYFIGDPHLQYLSWLGDLKLYIVAAAIALVSMPWIASQLDG
jgi:hypothetical protein